jgi:hypothetical protein
MRKLICAVAIIFTGCATHPTTDQFFASDAAIARECETILTKDEAADLKVNPKTGRSLATDVAICYELKMWSAVYKSRYANADLVADFAKHLVLLNKSRDVGLIDARTYLDERSVTIERFKILLANADAERSRQARKEFADKLAVFSGRMSALLAEQEAQRAAARPITTVCTPLGPFNTTSLHCTTR